MIFSTTVLQGEKVAIVGPTGAGKNDACETANAVL